MKYLDEDEPRWQINHIIPFCMVEMVLTNWEESMVKNNTLGGLCGRSRWSSMYLQKLKKKKKKEDVENNEGPNCSSNDEEMEDKDNTTFCNNVNN